MTQFEPFTEPLRRVAGGEAFILRLPNLNSVPAAAFSWLVGDLPISAGNQRKYVVTLDNSLVVLDAGQDESTHYRVEAYNEQLVERRASNSMSVIVEGANPLCKRGNPILLWRNIFLYKSIMSHCCTIGVWYKILMKKIKKKRK